MSAPHVFAPRRLPNAVLIEIVLRLLLAGVLIWQAFASGEALVAALCGLAACYHVAVALRMASWRIASLTRLTLDPWELTWREIGRDRRYGWAQVHATHATGNHPVHTQLGRKLDLFGSLLVGRIGRGNNQAVAALA